jgi:hypothetical protein
MIRENTIGCDLIKISAGPVTGLNIFASFGISISVENNKLRRK